MIVLLFSRRTPHSDGGSVPELWLYDAFRLLLACLEMLAA